MANMRAIRTHIKSVTNTQQITKAMKMVSASKLRRVQLALNSTRPFAMAAEEVINKVTTDYNDLNNAFFKPHEELKKKCFVLFIGNRGLCGTYNNTILHYMENLAKEESGEIEVIVCGRWGKDIIAKTGLPIAKTFEGMSDTPSLTDALALADFLKKRFVSETVDEVHLVYMEYVSALSQVPKSYQLFPIVPLLDQWGDSGDEIDFIFEPNRDQVVNSITELYVNHWLYRIMLEAKCGEHSARMTAMTTATDSTHTLLAELGLSLNRARQAAITTEITEIVGGASALKKGRNKR